MTSPLPPPLLTHPCRPTPVSLTLITPTASPAPATQASASTINPFAPTPSILWELAPRAPPRRSLPGFCTTLPLPSSNGSAWSPPPCKGKGKEPRTTSKPASKGRAPTVTDRSLRLGYRPLSSFMEEAWRAPPPLAPSAPRLKPGPAPSGLLSA
jgi:hypothetical protein